MTARRLITVGVALAVGVTVLGAPAAAATSPEGAYWHTRELTTTTHHLRFGTDSDPYSLVEQEVTERWSAPDGRSWFGFRELGSLPKTARDKKAWQRDGSPSTWDESIDGKTVKLSARPSRGSLTPPRKQDPFLLMDQQLTYDEVQRLPADPGRLKDWLTKAAKAAGEIDLAGSLGYSLTELLYDLPAPKEVRAAAYQALLTLPGTRAGGNAKDNLGRTGATVLIDHRTGTGKKAQTVKVRLIVDTGAMVLLSQKRSGTIGGKAAAHLSSDQTLIEVGWSDSQPAVPALP